jgi:cytochrome c553
VGLLIVALAHPLDAADPSGSVPADAGAAGQAGTGPDGAVLFATRCARCHEAPKLAARLQETPDPAGARARMTAFLGRHGGTDAEADAAIIEFLSGLSP